MTRKLARVWRLLPAAVLLAGCAVGPDFQSPAPPTEAAYTKQPLPAAAGAPGLPNGAQRFVPGLDIPGDWWTLFHSPGLNALIERALKASPDVQSAQAAMRVAMENRRAQIGNYFPAVTGNFNATRNQGPAELSPTLNSSMLLYNLYQAQLGVSWNLDIFGGNRRQVEALQAQEDAQRFQLEAVQIALASNITAAAIQEASLRAQIAATNDILDDEQKILVIEKQQNALGQISGGDVAAQEVVLAQAEQTLPPLQKQLAQQRTLLTALAGQLSDNEIGESFELSSLQLPQDLPVSLPSKLAGQRPDILVAGENLHMASAEIGVATANMLPNITLSAGGGGTATQLGQLLSAGNGFWNIGAGIATPILDGGTLLHRTRAARATYDQAAAQYRSTVITAFQNVADALHAIQTDGDALAAAVNAERAAARSLSIAQGQLKLGQISELALLGAQQAYQQSRIALVQAQASRFSDTAALFQALGGGWWNRKNLPETAPPP